MADIDDAPINVRLLWALRLIALGFGVFPLKDGAKEPVAGRSWYAATSTDEQTIRGWFLANPDMNYGVTPDDHHAIVDVDVKNGKRGGINLTAMEAQEELEDSISANTLATRTPSGGAHYFIEAPFAVSNSVKNFPSGIDVRGPGGYVVGPGSKLIEGLCDPKDTPGDYTIANDDIVMPAPAWLVNRLRVQGTKDEVSANPVFELDTDEAVMMATEWIRNRVPAIEGQEGDKHTLLTASGLIDFGLSEVKALELMIEPLITISGEKVSWNDTCVPPWAFDDLGQKVENAWKYRQTRPGSKGTDTAALDEAMERAAAYSDANPTPPKESKWAALELVGNEITDRDLESEQIIPNVLPAQGISAIIGERGLGKSAILIDMALRIVTGQDWYSFPIAPDYAVIYLCGEDDLGAAEMVKAWKLDHSVEDLPPRLRFFTAIVDLLNPEDCRSFVEYMQGRLGPGCRVVTFFDTWQRATAGAGQGDDEQMQIAFHHAEAIARSLNGPGVISCHPPKDGRATIMGSSIIENSTVAIWMIEKDAGPRTFQVIRIKGAREGTKMDFDLKVVNLGTTDQFGIERTGVVIDSTAHEVSKAGGVPSEVAQRIAYAKAIDEILNWPPDTGSVDLTIKVTAQRILGLYTVAKQHMGPPDREPTPNANHAQTMIDYLEKDGMLRVNDIPDGATRLEKLTTRIEHLFKGLSQGVRIDDKHIVKLVVRGKNKTPQFITEAVVMAKVDIEYPK